MKKIMFLFFGLALLFGFLQYKRYQKISRIKTEMATYVHLHSGGKYYFSWKGGSIPAQYIFPTNPNKPTEYDKQQILDLTCSSYIKERYASLMYELLSEWDYVGLMSFCAFFAFVSLILETIIKKGYENKRKIPERRGYYHAHVSA